MGNKRRIRGANDESEFDSYTPIERTHSIVYMYHANEVRWRRERGEWEGSDSGPRDRFLEIELISY